MDIAALSTALAPLLALPALALGAGALLGFAAQAFRVEGDPLVERIDALLPQTQCAQCGHPGCRPYAEAIAAGEAINKCPPGGARTIAALAELLGQAPQGLDASLAPAAADQVAYVREADCIGCAKCLPACPVDAILGAAKRLHTVLSSECTGCGLCVAPCPVDCIELRPAPSALLTLAGASGVLPLLASDAKGARA